MQETTNDIEIDNITLWDNQKRAKYTLLMFRVFLGITILSFLSDYFQLELLQSWIDGTNYTDAQAEANDLRQQIILFSYLLVFIIMVIVFWMWFRRAYGNLKRFGLRHLNHDEVWTIWAWVIPIISLFMPAQIMKELWDKNQQILKKIDPNHTIQPSGATIAIWWTLFMINEIVSKIMWQMDFDDTSFEGLIKSTKWDIASSATSFFGLLAAIYLIKEVTNMEKTIAQHLIENGGRVVDPD
jgi:heme/copper-type cytochrome/quinol oxidase subunit 2